MTNKGDRFKANCSLLSHTFAWIPVLRLKLSIRPQLTPNLDNLENKISNGGVLWVYLGLFHRTPLIDLDCHGHRWRSRTNILPVIALGLMKKYDHLLIFAR